MNHIIEIQGKWIRASKKIKPTRGRPNIYPFKALGIGSAFIHPNIQSATVLAHYWHKKLGHRYDIMQLGVGARIERVA